MKIVKTIEEIRQEIRQARQHSHSIGFVPTMGALHAGHRSLIEAARKQCSFVAVSIYVNPTQFGPAEDFSRYPRNVTADAIVCEKAGADVIFAPDDSVLYPTEQRVWVVVEKLTDNLCGRFRPGHFRGVATVCVKFFNIIGPDQAFFGQKDAQQVVVIRRMVTDLNLPLQIVTCPTLREPDGLAMSSRNQYLSPEQRKQAVLLSAALRECKRVFSQGQHNVSALIAAMRMILSQGPILHPEYVQIVDMDSLEDIDTVDRPALAAMAVRCGQTRLIDNCLLGLQNGLDSL
ncbi:MAG: pantoate--beta-alanine ligase [Phycisphaerae bacterium]|nr:pantoate--beta-alanine ligase [Phycisphaerae bacterium]